MNTTIAIALSALLTRQPLAPPAQCVFHPPTQGQKRWEGSCGPLFGQTPAMTLALVAAVTTGRWRSDASPLEVWAGDMTDGGGKAAIELEVYRGGQSVLRTEYGWYAVDHYSERDTILLFTVDTLKPVPPNDLDREIVKRADAILSSAAVWNRADDRKCPADAKTWSIYCAMTQAGIDVTGGAHHRRPAMELVREIVDARSAGRNYSHRLMDYNNDRTTTLAEVHSLFAEALARMAGSARAVQAAAPSPVAPAAPNRPLVTPQDIRIAERALEILSSPAKWDRNETQTCAPTAQTFGIYCALMKATVDVTGQADDSNGAFREARAVVDFFAVKRYSARLVGYNNDPATTFSDVQAFFHVLHNRLVRQP